MHLENQSSVLTTLALAGADLDSVQYESHRQSPPPPARKVFLFGLTAEQVERSRGRNNPRWHYGNEPETRAALDLIARNRFSRNEPGIFTPILDALLLHGDQYQHLADLASYARAHQRLCGESRNKSGLGERHCFLTGHR